MDLMLKFLLTFSLKPATYGKYYEAIGGFSVSLSSSSLGSVGLHCFEADRTKALGYLHEMALLFIHILISLHV